MPARFRCPGEDNGMRRTALLVIFIVGTLSLQLQGCAESVLIRAYPRDARITVNGEPLGTSPVQYTVPRQRWPQDGYFHYHVEHAGYQPQDGVFTSKPAGGRIAGGIFTLGVLFLFKGPTALPEEIQVVLEPVAATAPPASEANSSSPSQQMRRLEKLLHDGAITEEEFKRQRNKVLHDL
jgi:hypothetical protein